MDVTTALDRKGRLVLPKKVREEARIGLNAKVVVRAKGEGRIEIFDPDILLKKAQEIGSRKLKRWKEEDHEATELLSKLAVGHKDAAS